MAILSILFTVIIIAVSILMVLVVLIQRPKQEGLGAAFGGGALDSALGAHTTDVLQKFTTWLGIIFFVSAIGLAMVKTRQYKASAGKDLLQGVEAKQPELPGLPPEISNIPGLEGISVEPSPAAPVVPAAPAAPAGDAKPTETPAPAEAPKVNEAPKADPAPQPAADKPAPAPEAKPAAPAAPPAPAPEGKAKEQ